MLKKILNNIGLIFLALFLQLTLGKLVSIQDIKPDFLLIAVIFIGESRGKLYGEIWGFIVGLIADGIGLSMLFGISALGKTIAGFIGGFLHDSKRSMGRFYYYSIVATIMLIHFIIIYTIYYNSSEFNLQYIVLRYVIPSTIYTFIIYVLIDIIYPREQ